MPPYGGLLRAAVPPTGQDAQLALLESRLQAQADELLQMSSELRRRDDTCAALREQLAAAREEADSRRRRRSEDAATRELSTIHSDIDEKRRAIESLELAADASRRIGDLSDQNVRMQEDSARVRSTLLAAEDRAAGAAEVAESLRGELAQERERHTAELADGLRRAEKSHRDASVILRGEVARLGRQLAAATSEATGLRGALREQTARAEALADRLAERTDEAASWRSQLEAVQGGLLRAEGALSARDADLDATRQELTERMRRDLDSVAEAARVEHSALRQRIAKLHRDQESLRRRAEAAERSAREAAADAVAQREQLAAAEAARLEARRACEALGRRAADAQQEARAARAAAAEARSQALMEFAGEGTECGRHIGEAMFADEVRHLCGMARRLLAHVSGAPPEPAPGAADAQLHTLKRLLQRLESRTASRDVDLDEPPVLGSGREQRGEGAVGTRPGGYSVLVHHAALREERLSTRQQYADFYREARGDRIWDRAEGRDEAAGDSGGDRLARLEHMIGQLNAKLDRSGEGGANRYRLFAELASDVGSNPMDVGRTLGCIVEKAKALVGCERGAVFLVDRANEELYSEVLSDTAGGREVRIPINSGIAGHVVRTGDKVRVADAASCEFFNPSVDEATGFRTRNVLCLPIRHRAAEPGGPAPIIAAIQLVNKCGGLAEFTVDDEADLQAFALLCGVFLWSSSLLHFKEWSGNEASSLLRSLSNIAAHVRPAKPPESGPGSRRASIAGPLARSSSCAERLGSWRLADGSAPGSTPADPIPEWRGDVSRFFAKAGGRPTPDEVVRLRSIADFDVTLYPVGKPENDWLPALAVVMWRDLGLAESLRLSEEKLTRLTLAVRDRYRPIPYHNFNHAFDVAHAMYGFLTKGGARDLLTPLQILAVFVAALFHDCDHHGLNNNFHLKADTPLSLLMKNTSGSDGVSSVLEVHHCNVAIEVLAEPEVDVFAALDDSDRSQVWQDIIACILATDMHYHGTYCDRAKERLMDDEGKRQNRQLMMQMLLKAADLSNITKQFSMSRKWGLAVQHEFYLQGDRERELGHEVNPMFDRHKRHELRASQLGFMKGLGLPFYTLIAEIFPGMQYMLDGVRDNIRQWEETPPASPVVPS
eukprot:TRINITY_DN2728_c1_g1_i1.p1 TRINITY_DN2728_c1_g1~~TRINITY_DN2728_c1_g1_i1.p1  ORF type:complete len:1163 (+),score=310.54 TRINITY_DN2728_c1_g1_i1:122-3490(+)